MSAGLLKQYPVEMWPGPVGALETLVVPAQGQPLAVAVVVHPNPLHGGTHHNKVVQTVARTWARLGVQAYLPNLRGVGQSAGVHDHGQAEVSDVLAVLAEVRQRHGDLPLLLAGFSFGAYVQAQVAAQLQAAAQRHGLLLVGPACGKYPVPDVAAATGVIQGEQDEVIALSAVLDWARPQALPITVVPGVGHFFHGQLGLLGRLAEQWGRLALMAQGVRWD